MNVEAAVYWEDEAGLPDDEAVLVRAAQQDPTRFAPLYRHYRHRVYAYLRARAASEEDAADLTQQVFLQALAALPRYRIRSAPFGVWLFRIARNAATDASRRRRESLDWDTVPEALHPSTPSVDSDVIQREAVARLHTSLSGLDPATRDLLLLRFAARLTAPEIAAVTGKSTAATQKRLQRALHSLKERYHDRSI